MLQIGLWLEGGIAGELVRGLPHLRLLNMGGEREAKKTRRGGRVYLLLRSLL